MTQIMQDKYILGQSNSKAIGSVGEEIRLDLKLNPNTNDLKGGKVHGKVSNANGQGVPNSLVKLMSTSYEPLMHAMTDENGNYSLVNISSGSYNIFAIAKGMKLKQGNQFSVTELQDVSVDLTLEEDPSMKLAIIAGDLINSTSNAPVGGAVVSLFLNDNGTETLEAVTYTNEYGQYVFREVTKGQYDVRISALGYTSVGASASVTEDGQIVFMNISITPNANTSRGTVSGIITNSQNEPINRADVILYKVNGDNSLTAVAFTKTNQNGIYLFANVEKGTYKVKSNQIELVDIDVPDTWTYSPNFDYFTISPYAMLYVSATTGEQDGTQVGGAVIPGYVGSIGDNGGTVTVTANAPNSGMYVLGIQHLNGDADRILKIDINGTPTGETYTFPKTNDWTAGDAKILNVYVNLNQGANAVKFYNSPNAPGPWVGMLSFHQIVSMSATTGDLQKGAFVLGDYKDFVGAIGDDGGTATVSFNVPLTGKYMLGIQHLNGDADRIMKLDVNGTPTGETYTFSKTNSWNTSDAKVMSVEVNLNQGTNTVKFYNSPNAPAPWVGMLIVAPVISKSGTTGQMANGAFVLGDNSDFVGAIGDNGGTLTIDFNAPYAGKYVLGIQHLNEDADRIMKLDVNGTPTGETYSLPKTNSWHTPDATIFNVNLNLMSGKNTIKFYNSPNAPAPWVGMLYLKPNPEIMYYDATSATLEGSAKIENGMVTGIGANLGSLTLNASAPGSGMYNFTIGYVASDDSKKSNISVNNVSTGETYSFSKTEGLNQGDVETKMISLTLKSGSNNIKIYNEL